MTVDVTGLSLDQVQAATRHIKHRLGDVHRLRFEPDAVGEDRD